MNDDERCSFERAVNAGGRLRRARAVREGTESSHRWEVSMKRLICAASIAVLVLSAVSGFALPGNGAPSGAHYNLNIIGVAKNKTVSMTGSDRHSIFVPLQGKTNIYLQPGEFQVIDGNGTDSNGARFQLPDPDPDGDGVTSYNVFARALGKPGGSAVATSCVKDADGNRWCLTENVVQVRNKGKSSFSNVSKQLLTVCVDTDGDGSCDVREYLFDDATHDYFWEYDNKGLRVAQLRFYEIATVIGLTP
jgi:hypothetical protein